MQLRRPRGLHSGKLDDLVSRLPRIGREPETGLLRFESHRDLGIYGTTAFAFFLLAGVESLLMRAQLARPDNTLIGARAYGELFTMRGTTMVFLAVMPRSARPSSTSRSRF